MNSPTLPSPRLLVAGIIGLATISTAYAAETTPPTIVITQPTATTYLHTGSLTLDYAATDAGSGIDTVTATLDGATTVGGHGLASGQIISLLNELTPGEHEFVVIATDVDGNAATNSVTFEVIVTPQSIKQALQSFINAGKLKNRGLANSFMVKLNAAAAADERGKCNAAANNYKAFINHLRAQAGKGIDRDAAAILTADARYLIEHVCD